MLNLPDAIMAYLLPFAPLFSARVWRHAQLLTVGAILAPGQRMVAHDPDPEGDGGRQRGPARRAQLGGEPLRPVAGGRHLVIPA